LTRPVRYDNYSSVCKTSKSQPNIEKRSMYDWIHPHGYFITVCQSHWSTCTGIHYGIMNKNIMHWFQVSCFVKYEVIDIRYIDVFL